MKTLIKFLAYKFGQLCKIVGLFTVIYLAFSLWKWNEQKKANNVRYVSASERMASQRSRSVSHQKQREAKKRSEEEEFLQYSKSILAGQDILTAGIEKVKGQIMFPASFKIPFFGDTYTNAGGNRWKIEISFSATNRQGLTEKFKAIGVGSVNRDKTIKWYSFEIK